jgi:hypothetical protein
MEVSKAFSGKKGRIYLLGIKGDFNAKEGEGLGAKLPASCSTERAQ